MFSFIFSCFSRHFSLGTLIFSLSITFSISSLIGFSFIIMLSSFLTLVAAQSRVNSTAAGFQCTPMRQTSKDVHIQLFLNDSEMPSEAESRITFLSQMCNMSKSQFRSRYSTRKGRWSSHWCYLVIHIHQCNCSNSNKYSIFLHFVG